MKKVFYATRAEVLAAQLLVKLDKIDGKPVNEIHRMIADARPAPDNPPCNHDSALAESK